MKQTVEFRAPPKVTNADECRSWVEFAVNFVHAAIQTGGPGPSTSYSTSVRGLYDFLIANYMSGYSDVESWHRVVPLSSSSRNGVRAFHRLGAQVE